MNPENHCPSGEEDKDLRRLLEEAEQRKQDAMSRTGRKATWWILTPAVLLLMWVGSLLVLYQMRDTSEIDQASTPTEVDGTPGSRPDELNAFMPNSSEDRESGIISKGDVDFALDVMTFGGFSSMKAKHVEPPPGKNKQEP